jgi:hypothetical protein
MFKQRQTHYDKSSLFLYFQERWKRFHGPGGAYDVGNAKGLHLYVAKDWCSILFRSCITFTHTTFCREFHEVTTASRDFVTGTFNTVRRKTVSQWPATLSILLTNVEYIVPLIPLVEFKYKPAVRMDLKIDHMEKSSWQTTNNRSGSQIPPPLWRRVYINPPCVPTLRWLQYHPTLFLLHT